MQKHFLKFRKVFTNIACSPLILISNNSELAAKYLPNDFEQKIITSEINNENNSLFQGIYTCLLYTSPSPRDKRQSRMPSSA